MERQLWKQIVTLMKGINKRGCNVQCDYSDAVIVKTWLWAVLHDRPVSWACQTCNWPICERRWQRPSGPTMSRRLRSKSVRWLLDQIEKLVLDPMGLGNIVWMIDGKPLTISGHSKDRQAGYGRATGGKAKGYKIHAIVGSDGSVPHWRIAPMNKDERVMAGRMLKQTKIQGYLVADSNYDSNKLHQTCDDRGNLQLIAARRYGSGCGYGHRKQTDGRLRSVEILEHHTPDFGKQMMMQRNEIERFYGNLTNWGGGLTHLPPWIRTYRRVHRWVQAKFIINAIKRLTKQTTYNDP